MASANPYKLFDVVLRHKQQLSPHLMRITLASPTVTEMATWAPDQRVKLFFPAADGSPAKLSQGEGWYARFRSMLIDRRPAMRTYTIRHLRAESGEVDIDFVLHGETGPASRWALRAQPGESMQILAPDSDSRHKRRGDLNGNLRKRSSNFFWSPMPQRCRPPWGFWKSWRHWLNRHRPRRFLKSTVVKICWRFLTGPGFRCNG